MKLRFLFIVSLLITACTSEQSDQTKKSSFGESNEVEITALGERYYELGRFSGCILVSTKDEVLYQKYFGYADHTLKEEFTSETAFILGSLSQFLMQQILDDKQLNQLEDKNNDFENMLVDLSKDLDLTNTFYKNSDLPIAKGHLYLNEGNGLEWTIAKVENPETSFDLSATPLDVLKLIQSIDTANLSLNDYTPEDEFSYSIDKKGDNCIIILSNNRQPVGKEMSTSIQAILDNQPYLLPLKREAIEINSDILENYTGVYKLNDNMNLEMLVENDSLFVKMGENKMYLTPQSDHQFFMDFTDAALRFVRDEEGKVIGAMRLDGFTSGPVMEKLAAGSSQ